MLYQVKTINGQKTKIPLSDPAPTGNPIGTIISTYKKIQPKNYLYCDGSFFDQDQYPALYLYLGSNQLPDYRECVQVGAEQNTTDIIAAHDVYTQGEFKDDQLQSHGHFLRQSTSVGGAGDLSTYGGTYVGNNIGAVNTVNGARTGATTHGKQKAVYYYIKAVDGVDISDEDTFLNTVKDYVDNRIIPVYFDELSTSSYIELPGTYTPTNGYQLVSVSIEYITGGSQQNAYCFGVSWQYNSTGDDWYVYLRQGTSAIPDNTVIRGYALFMKI